MPQSWQTHWPLGALDPAQLELAAQHRRTAVHRIGNLTLVTSQFNQGVSNFGWDAKRPEFSLQSSLQLNKPVSTSDQWDESTIQLRSEQLADAACRVWVRAFKPASSA